MYYILVRNGEYYIEGRKGNLPDNIIGKCANDSAGRPILDINCYTIEETNDDYKIYVDHKQWLISKANNVI